MKIKDLITELSKCNPESDVLFSNSIECFRSMSVCSFQGSHRIDEYTKKELKKELEDHEFGDDGEDSESVRKEILSEVDKTCVVFSVSGEETSCD
jgi:hypothetical protein